MGWCHRVWLSYKDTADQMIKPRRELWAGREAHAHRPADGVTDPERQRQGGGGGTQRRGRGQTLGLELRKQETGDQKRRLIHFVSPPEFPLRG